MSEVQPEAKKELKLDEHSFEARRERAAQAILEICEKEGVTLAAVTVLQNTQPNREERRK